MCGFEQFLHFWVRSHLPLPTCRNIHVVWQLQKQKMHACNIYDLVEYKLLICIHAHTHTLCTIKPTHFVLNFNFIHINPFYQLNCTTRFKFIHISFFLLFNNKPSINKDLNKTNREQKPTAFEKLCWLLM